MCVDSVSGTNVLVNNGALVERWSAATTNHQLAVERHDGAGQLVITTGLATNSSLDIQNIILIEIEGFVDACNNVLHLWVRAQGCLEAPEAKRD